MRSDVLAGRAHLEVLPALRNTAHVQRRGHSAAALPRSSRRFGGLGAARQRPGLVADGNGSVWKRGNTPGVRWWHLPGRWPPDSGA